MTDKIDDNDILSTTQADPGSAPADDGRVDPNYSELHTRAAHKMYHTMGEKSLGVMLVEANPDARAVDKMYPSVTEAQFKKTDTQRLKEEGWGPITDAHIAAFHRFPTERANYDVVFDDPNNPEGGGMIRRLKDNEPRKYHGEAALKGNW